ncbi:hypothetical protein GCM10009800_51980 [Nocardiopsis rhodophaea]
MGTRSTGARPPIPVMGAMVVVPVQEVGISGLALGLWGIRRGVGPFLQQGPSRAEGLLHPQAVLCLARQRINVLWAMLRDGRIRSPQRLDTVIEIPHRLQPGISGASH